MRTACRRESAHCSNQRSLHRTPTRSQIVTKVIFSIGVTSEPSPLPQSFVAEVVLTHQDFPLASTLAEVPEAVVTEESIRPPTDSDVPAVLYRVTDVGFQEFESALESDHTVHRWRLAMDFGSSRVYRTQLSSATKFVTPTLSELGIHVILAQSANKGWRFKLETAEKETLGEFWDHCRDEGVQFELEKIFSSSTEPVDRRVDFRSELTDRQREIARTATQMGYYDQDGASAEEVATELGIASSTLSTHLRRINAKLFHDLFADES